VETITVYQALPNQPRYAGTRFPDENVIGVALDLLLNEKVLSDLGEEYEVRSQRVLIPDAKPYDVPSAPQDRIQRVISRCQTCLAGPIARSIIDGKPVPRAFDRASMVHEDHALFPDNQFFDSERALLLLYFLKAKRESLKGKAAPGQWNVCKPIFQHLRSDPELLDEICSVAAELSGETLALLMNHENQLREASD